ncbi:MAG TPA: Tex family protein [Bacteroidales bacterium]|nr:Tex family protein [Bacteroidales bacterium]
MNAKHVEKISAQMGINAENVENTISLLEQGATIPFISRYRKEMTGSLDEVQVAEIKRLMEKLIEIDNRRETILNSIEEQGKLSDELRSKIEACSTLSELEDLYLPYKPKRRTRATIAKEKGLEPLAGTIMKQQTVNIYGFAEKFINKDVANADEAIAGATDIIAEWVNENVRARNQLRKLFRHEALIISKVVKGKEPDAIKYGDYFEFSEPLKRCPSHRFMAMHRGEEEGFLKISIEPAQEKAIAMLEEIFIKADNECSDIVKKAITDSYKRLLGPSIETEIKGEAKEKADDEAIRVFSENLRQLLLAPPLGQKQTLAIDPGFRTGCKVVILDNQGKLLHNETIYPHPPQNERGKAAAKINALVNTYNVEAIAIGNGTASRETENFIKTVRFERDIKVYIVNESGASVYSASQVARDEFPEYDVTVRGAVSIGRRLMDPLAELVKIDPKSIGVGQYQHDVDQGKLKKSLDQVVELCVNSVGVELNTASKQLLSYVSGLGPALAAAIVAYRNENGAFESRKQLMKVPRLGEKAFEQCAGFLRIRNAHNPLDSSAVHPESYPIVEKMAADVGTNVEQLIKDVELQKKIDIKRYVTAKTGLPTLQDIMQELSKPGRDPRTIIKVFEFDPNVQTVNDLKEGMVLPGIVTNITRFGCFVDVGVHQDGLVHISHLANRFVSDPNEIVKLHQHVRVKVIEIDKVRNRIQLSMKEVE